MKDVAGVMDEWEAGKLHSGSKTGPLVKKKAQALAIGISEQKKLKSGKSFKRSH